MVELLPSVYIHIHVYILWLLIAGVAEVMFSQCVSFILSTEGRGIPQLVPQQGVSLNLSFMGGYPSACPSTGGVPQSVIHGGVSLSLSLNRGYPSICPSWGGIPQPVPQQGVSLNLSIGGVSLSLSLNRGCPSICHSWGYPAACP